MGKVEQLRTSATPPRRTPEREALAKAIARDAELEAEIARTAEALRKARDLASRAEDAETTLERSLVEAKEGAPQRLVASLLNGDAAEDDPVAQIEAALEKARGDGITYGRAVAMLVEQHRALTDRRKLSQVESAIAAVVMAEAFPAILAEHERRRTQLAESGAVLGALYRFTNYDASVLRTPAGYSGAAASAWRDALAVLAGSADAPLPAAEPASGPGPEPEAA